MSRLRARARLLAAAGALGAAACGPVSPPPPSDATTNACPTHPCAAYAQADAAQCVAGACLVSQAALTGLLLVVDLPEDNPFAPGQTYVEVLDGAFLANPVLPNPVQVRGNLVANPQQANTVGFFLGNPTQDTVLPMRATFRRLLSLGGGPPVEASTIGLPVLPVVADSVPYPNDAPGPFQGPSLDFQSALPPGLYERTVMPDPPLDEAFPPDVQQIVEPGVPVEVPLVLDTTNETSPTGVETYPAFCISSWNGQVDGWTAYLRDATTKRRISNLRTLSGSPSCTTEPLAVVPLMTDHHPATLDALQNAELVVVPPPGEAYPTWVLAPQGGMLSQTITYPQLPSPVTVQGAVIASADPDAGAGSPEGADIIFEATGIDDLTSLNVFNFEYTAETRASIDANGDATYTVVLPPGEYRVTARPVDLAAEVTVIPSFFVPPGSPSMIRNFSLSPQQPVSGSVKVTDGRPLVGAAVEAVPVQCSGGAASAWCVPRSPAPAITGSNGTFSLAVDEGGYFLRVRPADGTSLPWVVQPMLVTPGGVRPAIHVPAPFYAPISLTMEGSPVVNAIVRVYDTSYVTPQNPSAAQVFRAITDTSGSFDLVLAPPIQ